MEKKSSFLKYAVLVIVIFIVWIIAAKSDSFINLITYKWPALGDYYFWLETDKNGNVIGHTYYEQDIYKEELSLDNIKIMYSKTKSYYLGRDRDISLNDTDIRIFILENGIGIINDERFATKDEIDAQEKAKQEGIGYWENQETEHETSGKAASFTWHNTVSTFWGIIDKINITKSLYYIVFSVIGLGTIISIVVKLILRTKLFIVLFGEPDSGKTTFCNRVLDPYMHSAKLKHQTMPTTYRDVFKCESIPYKGLKIIPCAVDNPGAKTGAMFDDLISINHVNTVAVIVLPYSDDPKKILRDTGKALIVARTIKQSVLYSKVRKVILFINKADEYFDSYDSFVAKETDIVKTFVNDDFEELAKLVDCTVIGSALEGWNVDVVLDKAINK